MLVGFLIELIVFVSIARNVLRFRKLFRKRLIVILILIRTTISCLIISGLASFGWRMSWQNFAFENGVDDVPFEDSGAPKIFLIDVADHAGGFNHCRLFACKIPLAFEALL